MGMWQAIFRFARLYPPYASYRRKMMVGFDSWIENIVFSTFSCFCVKVIIPANLISWSKAPVDRNVSGNQAVLDLYSQRTSAQKSRLASASSLVKPVSFSTQGPPIVWNSPDPILTLTRANWGWVEMFEPFESLSLGGWGIGSSSGPGTSERVTGQYN